MSLVRVLAVQLEKLGGVPASGRDEQEGPGWQAREVREQAGRPCCACQCPNRPPIQVRHVY
jgi:hypothetical protein